MEQLTNPLEEALDSAALNKTVDLSALKLGMMPLSTLLSALITLLVCLVAMRILRSALKKGLSRANRLDAKVSNYILVFTRILLWIITILIVADQLGIPITSLIALLSVCTLAVSLAVQTVLSNVAGGIVLFTTKPFRIGDYISVDGGEGYVQEIRLTYTTIDTRQNERHVIPNSVLSAGQIVNYTATDTGRRLDMVVTASYDAPIAAVRSACMEAMADYPGRVDRPCIVDVNDFGESSIAYNVICWVEPTQYWLAKGVILENIKAAFDRHGIEMTYNHLNVHMMKD